MPVHQGLLASAGDESVGRHGAKDEIRRAIDLRCVAALGGGVAVHQQGHPLQGAHGHRVSAVVAAVGPRSLSILGAGALGESALDRVPGSG